MDHHQYPQGDDVLPPPAADHDDDLDARLPAGGRDADDAAAPAAPDDNSI